MTEEKKIPDFVIDQSDTIEWPVTVHLPVDGGEMAAFRFTGVFNRMSEAEMDELLGSGNSEKVEVKGLSGTDVMTFGNPVELPQKRMAEVLEENAALFPKFLVGWKGVKTAAGDEVPFDVAMLQKQIIGPNGPFISSGLWNALREIRTGARLGN